MRHKEPLYWVDALVNIREELVAAESGEDRGSRDPALPKATHQSSDSPKLPSAHPNAGPIPPSIPVSTPATRPRKWSPAALLLRFSQAIKHRVVVIVVLGIAFLAATFLTAYRRIAAQTV